MVKLSLNGQCLTLSTLAFIATTLERDGCMEIVNCAMVADANLGTTALTLGMAMAEKVKELNGSN